MATTKRRSLLQLIQKHLNMSSESTLEKVLELLEDIGRRRIFISDLSK